MGAGGYGMPGYGVIPPSGPGMYPPAGGYGPRAGPGFGRPGYGGAYGPRYSIHKNYIK